MVACMGLFGLISFSVERKAKEISIRKILGASGLRITSLLTRRFLLLVLLANVIAWPLTYLIMIRWLENFAYRINLNLSIFVFSGLAALMIAIFTISLQVIRAALSNPADILRDE